MTPDAPAAQQGAAPRQLQALETIASVMHDLDVDAPSEAFYSRICDRICELTTLDRVVIFRYDERLRDVAAVGAHGVGREVFAGRRLSVATATPAQDALERDRIVVTEGDEGLVDPAFRDLVADRRVLWVPMVAADRWMGVVVGTQPTAAEPPSESERGFLFAVSKSAALAAVARMAARQAQRAARMRTRLDLAREIHDGVVQRLFGIALALEPLADGDDDVARIREELQGALSDLRAALERPLAPETPVPHLTLGVALERLSSGRPPVVLVRGAPEAVPDELGPVVQAMVAEALRNAVKHANASVVELAIDADEETLAVEATNDGVPPARGPRAPSGGMGLRLLALEALQLGGVLDYGPREGGRWTVRLVVPLEA